MCRTITFSERSYVYCIGSSLFFHLFSQQVGHLAPAGWPLRTIPIVIRRIRSLPSWSLRCAGEDYSDQVSNVWPEPQRPTLGLGRGLPKETAFKLIPAKALLRTRMFQADGKACAVAVRADSMAPTMLQSHWGQIAGPSSRRPSLGI